MDVVDFLYSWQQLDTNDKAMGLDAFTAKDVPTGLHPPPTTVGTLQLDIPTNTYEGVQLYSYYSYIYYYPIMNWHLDRTPETNDYWVGIYRKGAAHTDYITFQWLYQTAQGSYNVGKIGDGLESRERFEEFELRIFKGDYQRVDAVTNILRGTIEDAPTANPDEYKRDMAVKQLDQDTREFIQAIQTFTSLGTTGHGKQTRLFSLPDLQTQWDTLTKLQQQLLLPVLEQEALPDSIKNPGPKALDRPEPRIYFTNLGKVEALRGADDPNAPQEIVLTITLEKSSTYIYPVVNVTITVPADRAWMGVYHTKSDLSFNPDAYIDNDWQWIGPGEEGLTKLNNIKEESNNNDGSVRNQYLGVIFKGTSPDEQMGLASSTIVAATATTPAAPPPDFKPDFDKVLALHYARMSTLAYEEYSKVEKELRSIGYTPEMQIYHSETDTNGFIASNETSVVVAFCGTRAGSWPNYLTNAWFLKEEIIPGQESLAHGGFIHAFNTVNQAIASKLDDILGSKALFITGHSLGGALASLLMYHYLKEHPFIQPKMYVYGCPPVGDEKFAESFKGKDSNTITIENDPISSGELILLGNWAGLYKPVLVKYLPKAAGHGINDYIQQLEKLK